MLGFYSIWELIVRLAGKAKFELSGDQLKYKKGIGLVGFSGSLQWSQVQHINLDVTEKKLHIYTSEFDSKDGYEEIYLDLSMCQLNYIEKFLSDKLSQSERKSSVDKK